MTANFIGSLPPASADRLTGAGPTRHYPARSYIFHEGDTPSGVLIVESGLLRVDRTTPSGRVVLLDLSSTGELLGEIGVLQSAHRSATVSTISEARVCHIPAAAFMEAVADDPAINRAVIERLARRLRSLTAQFYETAMLDASRRVAARLVRLVDIESAHGRCKVEADGSVELKMPISQEDLGQWSGLAREGTVKGLGTLRSVDLIATGRMRVIIHNFPGLVAWAEDGG